MGCSDSKPAPQAKAPKAPKEKKPETPKVEKKEEKPAPVETKPEPKKEEPKKEVPKKEEPKPEVKKEVKKPAASKPAAPKANAPVRAEGQMSGRADERQRVLLEMEKARLSGEVNDACIKAFTLSYDALVKGETGVIKESSIKPVDKVTDAASLKKDDGAEALLSKTVVLKLNGGLGTGMGLTGPKSSLVVKEGKTFMDYIVKQIEELKSTAPSCEFMLMNSFSTEEEAKKVVDANPSLGSWDKINLLQNKVIKIDANTMEPVSHSDEHHRWCPPGHGDLYAALYGSGKLQELVSEGKEYLFVSNSDNLGATMDLAILSHFANSGKGFMMEVAERAEADKKGGHLAKKGDGYVLRESAQCSKEDMGMFQNIATHKYFNTNNLWLNIPKLFSMMQANDGVMKLPLIRNAKTVVPTDPSSKKVYQLETAMGSAIALFGADAEAVCVGRSRFAPVKTTSDLFTIQSDAYEVDGNVVKLVDQCQGNPPAVSLGDQYKLVPALEALCANYTTVPSLKDCRTLDILGTAKLTFGAGVVCTGNAVINVGNGDDKTIADRVVTGEVDL